MSLGVWYIVALNTQRCLEKGLGRMSSTMETDRRHEEYTFFPQPSIRKGQVYPW
jgi:hypothetical protein